MTIEVEKGVPIPSKTAPHSKYPFSKMSIGDSFFAPVNTPRIWGSISAYCKRHGGKFTARAVTENGVQGVRVWKLE